jgi:glycosyltransferase involved in cell wall biosynthesis
MKVALIGPYPPPFGGISVSIQRLKDLLEERGVVCHVYDTLSPARQIPGVTSVHGRRFWVFRYWRAADEDIIHYQDPNWKVRVLLGLLPWRAQTVISVQGNSLVDAWSEGGCLRRALIRLALRRISYIILSNPDYVKFVQSLGVSHDRVAVIPAFIPPLVKEHDDALIPSNVWDFSKAHTPILVANGAIAFYQGEDLYGLDLLIELVQALKDVYPRVGLICPLRPIAGSVAQDYWEVLQARVESCGLGEHICWITDGLPVMHPLMRHSDLFVRPTNTDGDAVSIREALHFGVPVVASDVSPRPQGAVLFRNRDVGDLILQAKRILSGELVPEATPVVSSFERIWQIYLQLISSKKHPTSGVTRSSGRDLS